MYHFRRQIPIDQMSTAAIRAELARRQRWINRITSGERVSSCQHRTARNIEEEGQSYRDELDRRAGRTPQRFIEPVRTITEAEVTKLETLIQRRERRGEAQHPEALLARQILDDPERRVTEAQARRLGIGR